MLINLQDKYLKGSRKLIENHVHTQLHFQVITVNNLFPVWPNFQALVVQLLTKGRIIPFAFTKLLIIIEGNYFP